MDAARMKQIVSILEPENLRARVALGANRADVLWPGWWERTDFQRLDMGDHRHCLIGQMEGDFRWWVEAGIPDQETLAQEGFWSKIARALRGGWDARESYEYMMEEYHLLKMVWTEEGFRRRTQT